MRAPFVLEKDALHQVECRVLIGVLGVSRDTAYRDGIPTVGGAHPRVVASEKSYVHGYVSVGTIVGALQGLTER